MSLLARSNAHTALRRLSNRPPIAIVAAAAAVLVVCGYPLAQLAYQSLFAEGRLDVRPYALLLQGDAATAMVHTLVTSMMSAGIGLALGALLALLVQRSDLPAARVFATALLLPLLMPPFVQAVAWLEAYARGGLVFQWSNASVDWLRGPAGIIVLLSLQTYPLVYLLTGAQLASQRGVELEEAARSAGAGQWRALLDVTLPRLQSALAAAALIAFVSAASDFGVPAALGIPAGYTVVTTLIYRRLSLSSGAGSLAEMIALSTLLALVALVAVAVATRLTAGSAGGATLTRRGGIGAVMRLGPLRWPLAALLAACVIAAMFLPLLALFLQAVARVFVPSLNPSQWTDAHFVSVLNRGGLVSLAHSVGLAAGAALVVAAGGALVAAAGRQAGAAGRAVEGLAALPFALPGSVVAVAAILAWQRWLYGTFAIILLAYVARFAIFGVRAAAASLGALPEELLQAARSAGASPWRATLDVQRPLIQPGILASFALVFLLAVHELTISSLLYTPQTQTMAVQVLNAEQAGDLPSTAALAVIVTAVTLAAALPLVFSRRIRRLVGAELGG